MGVIDLLAGSIVDFPVLNLTSLGTEEHVVLIDLENFCGRSIQLESLQIIHPCSFEINTSQVDEGLPVICKAKNRRRLLDDSLIPLDFNHLIFVGGNSIALVLLYDYWLGLWFWNLISIFIILNIFCL